MKGGDKLDDIQRQLDDIQKQVNDLKNNSGSSMDSLMPETSVQETYTPEKTIIEETVSKTWQDDKNLKFKDGSGGRVQLSFPRIMTLINNNLSKGNTNKDWATIKQKLNDANSVSQVQDVINEYKISFSSNYVAGTRKKRRGGRRKTSKRY
jgi:hypothetical protein